jgi:hypothetical protein
MEGKQKESAGPHKQQVTNKASGQSMQANVVNNNSMDDMYFLFTMVQQILTGLSGAASEEETVLVITKAAFSLLKHNGR